MQRLPGGSNQEPPPDEGASQRATADDARPRTKVAALTAAQRRRLPHIGPTVEREIDVERAFAEEHATAPAATTPDVSPPRSSGRRDHTVHVLVPLDAVPEVVIADSEVPWSELEPLDTEVLMRIDGSKNAMSIVTGLSAPPSEGVRALASLICRGIVRLPR
jgi:hypothetical protein